jgi:NitT/TauT family transport system permease protein
MSVSQTDNRSTQTRTKRKQRLFEFKKPIPVPRAIALGIAIWVIFFAIWEVVNLAGWSSDLLLPTPQTVVVKLYELFAYDEFLIDVLVSIYRIVVSFSIVCLIAIPLGILMGSFQTVEKFFNPLVSAWRYLPAPSLIPLLLMWLGAGDESKLALLVLGAIWFMLTLIMDHTKAVRNELLETSVTLGGSRWQVLWTVVVPAVMPNVLIAMRQMLAISWTYLVIAEIIAATDGIGAMMIQAKRFIHVDKIMAGILMIGILGLLFDFLFRYLHRVLFAYLDERES